MEKRVTQKEIDDMIEDGERRFKILYDGEIPIRDFDFLYENKELFDLPSRISLIDDGWCLRFSSSGTLFSLRFMIDDEGFDYFLSLNEWKDGEILYIKSVENNLKEMIDQLLIVEKELR
jgi:hypothetical protein